MNTRFYAIFDRSARAWWGYKGDRAKQRESIRHNLQSLRDVLACPGAFVTLSNDGHSTTVHWKNTTSQGYGLEHHSIARAAVEAGVPMIDFTAVPFETAAKVAIRGPIPTVDPERDEGQETAFSYIYTDRYFEYLARHGVPVVRK